MICHFSDMALLQKCVVAELEHCEESTPANLVDAMFRFVRNKTPCANITTASRSAEPSTGTGHSLVQQYSVLTSIALVASSFLFSRRH